MLLATAAVFALSAAASELRVHFMDIDRNDGILIECDGEAAFIDSGTHDYGVKAVGYMQSAGVEKLTYYIGTHAHRDHVGGGAPILLRDLLSEMGRQLGRKRVRFLSVPHWLAYGGAVGLFGLSLGRLDLREKVQRLCEDRAYPHDEARRDFGYDPLPFSEGVRNEILEYLNKKQS